jgi:hypothetical protein
VWTDRRCVVRISDHLDRTHVSATDRTPRHHDIDVDGTAPKMCLPIFVKPTACYGTNTILRVLKS